MNLTPRQIARALGGTVTGRDSVNVPGPGHGKRDRSLSIKLSPTAPDGFIVYSHAGDDALECKDYVREGLGLESWRPGNEPRQSTANGAARRSKNRTEQEPDDDPNRQADALRIWRACLDPRGTLVERYLASRALELDDLAIEAVRFHPALSFKDKSTPAMVALFRDIRTNEPVGIHRTFLDYDARKLDRMMLGRAGGAAIKLDHHEEVASALFIGEGIETCLAARLAGFRPVWALGSAGAIGAFPVLPGVDAISILGELNDGGANHRATQVCAARWDAAGREVFTFIPTSADDLNDAWQEAVQ